MSLVELTRRASWPRPAPIDPFRGCPDGWYADELVTVAPIAGTRDAGTSGSGTVDSGAPGSSAPGSTGRPASSMSGPSTPGPGTSGPGTPGPGTPGPSTPDSSTPDSSTPGPGTFRFGTSNPPPAPHCEPQRTRSFELWRDHRIHVRHRIREEDIDDTLAERLSRELFGPGLLAGNELFERVFTGIVLSSRPGPREAWQLFYRNTRRKLAPTVRSASAPVTDALSEFGAIYRRVDGWVPAHGTVLEVGSCFGFLALHLARLGPRRVIASDVSARTMQLLAAVAPRLGLELETRHLDARALALPDASVDTAVLVHLLEHLHPADGELAVAEALRVARRRVVIAVPYEDEPDPTYGHLRVVRRNDLEDWGRRAAGWSWRVDDFHGGWLVLDR